jgi:hypothetical protein
LWYRSNTLRVRWPVTVMATPYCQLRLCSARAVVVPQQSAQPFAATNLGTPERAALSHDQLIAEPLMVARPRVVRPPTRRGRGAAADPRENGGRGTARGSNLTPDRARVRARRIFRRQRGPPFQRDRASHRWLDRGSRSWRRSPTTPLLPISSAIATASMVHAFGIGRVRPRTQHEVLKVGRPAAAAGCGSASWPLDMWRTCI